MSSTIAACEEVVMPGRIIYLVGERHPERLTRLLGVYLCEPQVERVILVTATSATASWVAAPYADEREKGRLATVLANDDVVAAIHAARRGWGEPDVMISTGGSMWGEQISLPLVLANYAAD